MRSIAAKRARAVWLKPVERAGSGEAFQHALVDGARVDAVREVGQVGKGLVAAAPRRSIPPLARRRLERGERVMDGVAVDIECDAGAVDAGRLDLDAEPLGLGAKLRELVGVAHFQRHRGGQELDRVIRLHIGGLIGDQRVGRGVALVEAVFGETFEQIEDRVGLGAVHAALGRAHARNACAAPASPCGFSCPWRGAAGRPGRACSRRGSAPPASPVPGRR